MADMTDDEKLDAEIAELDAREAQEDKIKTAIRQVILPYEPEDVDVNLDARTVSILFDEPAGFDIEILLPLRQKVQSMKIGTSGYFVEVICAI